MTQTDENNYNSNTDQNMNETIVVETAASVMVSETASAENAHTETTTAAVFENVPAESTHVETAAIPASENTFAGNAYLETPAVSENPLMEPTPSIVPEHVPAENIRTETTAPVKKRSSARKLPKKFPGKFRKCLAVIGSAVLFGIIAGGTFIGFNLLYYHINPSAYPVSFSTNKMEYQPGPNSTKQHPAIASTVVSQQASIATADVSGIVDQAMPSLVSISCTFRTSSNFFGYLYEGTTSGSGSGIIVGRNDNELLIATNNHVIDEAITTTVTFPDGTEASAVTKGKDSSADLAIISVPLNDLSAETLDSIRVASLGDSNKAKVGQMVIAIGNALGYGQTTTVGYLSAKEREITVQDSSTGRSTKMIALQVDAAINPGNSGGALLNIEGEVIGINSAKLSGTSVEGIGYAIPISNVTDILTELMNREILSEEEQGYLGVYLSSTDITADISATYGWPMGVYILETVENGAAAKYGILAGDIITAVNDTEVRTRVQLQEKINSYRSGTTVSVTIQRLENGSYAEHVLEVVLGSKADFDND